VGHQLRLMKEFGRRLNEAILLRPAASDQGESLLVEHSTKGGRTRMVPIRTPAQREALDAAKALAVRSSRGSMVPTGMTRAQARNRL
jgi:hypothetical protein